MTIKEKCSKFNYLILVHTKAHQDTGYAYFSQLNSLADKNAKCLARNTLMNLLPRNPNEREQEPNNTQSNLHSTSEASNEPGQRFEKRSITSQGLDEGPS